MNDQPNTTDDVEGHAGSPAGLATGLGEGAVYGWFRSAVKVPPTSRSPGLECRGDGRQRRADGCAGPDGPLRVGPQHVGRGLVAASCIRRSRDRRLSVVQSVKLLAEPGLVETCARTT